MPNRKELIEQLNGLCVKSTPEGWELVTVVAVGGLTEIGFSKKGNYLLISSSAGRGLFDCKTGENIARDRDVDGEWFDSFTLKCKGIDLIADEIVDMSGLSGGGLPSSNQFGDGVELTAQNWPIYDLYFCPQFQSALISGHDRGCARVDSGYIRAYGFSWCGQFLVSATGSDFKLWRKL